MLSYPCLTVTMLVIIFVLNDDFCVCIFNMLAHVLVLQNSNKNRPTRNEKLEGNKETTKLQFKVESRGGEIQVMEQPSRTGYSGP